MLKRRYIFIHDEFSIVMLVRESVYSWNIGGGFSWGHSGILSALHRRIILMFVLDLSIHVGQTYICHMTTEKVLPFTQILNLRHSRCVPKKSDVGNPFNS